MRRIKGPKFQNQPSRKKKQQVEQRHPLVGEVFEAKVADLNSDGLGVVEHSSGLKVFVPGVCLDETISAKIIEHRGRWALGSLCEIVIASENRVSPPCAIQGFTKGKCGGCAWMHMHYEEQLRIKQNKVEQALNRVFTPENSKADQWPVKKVIPSPKPLHYRNRAQFKSDGERLGFMEYNSKDIAEVEDCLILSEKNRKTLKELRSLLPNHAWKVKSAQARKKKHWTRIDIDESCDAQTASINQRLAFQQANDLQNQNMKQWLTAQFALIDRSATVLELFAGSGNFTQVISDLGFKSITAMEVVEQAVEDLNHITGVNVLACDLFDESSMRAKLDNLAPQKILLLDPPRDGFKTKETFFNSAQGEAIEKIIYISCDLATFTRDADFFLQKGFVCKELQPIDMFPQTPHIELMAVFEK